MGSDLVGHTKWIDGATFSPDGHKIASVSDDLTVRLWNADTGQPIGQPMMGHQDQVWAVSFSPDGHMLASGSVDRTVRLWNADTGQPIGQPLRHPDRVISVEFSPDGRRVVSGNADGTLRLWDVRTGQQSGPSLTGHTGEVIDVAFSPDGRRIASAGGDGDVRLWDAETGLPIGEPMSAQGSRVLSVAFSPDGHRLASGSGDGAVRLWDADTRQLLGNPCWARRVECGHYRSSRRHTPSLGIAGRDDPFGGCRHTSATVRPYRGRVQCGGEPDEHRIARRVTTARCACGRRQRRPIGSRLSTATSRCPASRSAGRTTLAVAGADGTVRIWDAHTGMAVGDPIDPGQGPLTSVAFSPDGRRLAIGGGDTSVGVWTITMGPSGCGMLNRCVPSASRGNTANG